jgi:serine/threonine protein kinase
VLVAQKNPIKVKLSDFGISKITEGTDLKTQIGTFGYIAPEVFGLLEYTGESSRYTYSSAVDIWSLGCLLYSVLTGHSPFPGSSYLPLGDYVNGRRGFPEIPLLEREVSLAGRSFILKLMSPSPERRPKATVDLLDDWIIPLRVAEPFEKPGFPMAKPKLLVTSSKKHDNDQIMPQPADKRDPSKGVSVSNTLVLPREVNYKADMV